MTSKIERKEVQRMRLSIHAENELKIVRVSDSSDSIGYTTWEIIEIVNTENLPHIERIKTQ